MPHELHILCYRDPQYHKKSLVGNLQGPYLSLLFVNSLWFTASARDSNRLAEVETALTNVGLSDVQISEIFKVLGGVLLLCNLSFVSEDESEACYLDDTQNGECAHKFVNLENLCKVYYSEVSC